MILCHVLILCNILYHGPLITDLIYSISIFPIILQNGRYSLDFIDEKFEAQKGYVLLLVHLARKMTESERYVGTDICGSKGNTEE